MRWVSASAVRIRDRRTGKAPPHKQVPQPAAFVQRQSPEWRLRVARLRALNDFRAFELVTSLRLPWSVSKYRRVVTALLLLGAPIGTVLLFGLLQALKAGAGTDLGRLSAIMAIGVAGVFFWSALYASREVTTERRFGISDNPNIALFRGLDIGALEVFLVYRARSAALYYGVLAVVGGSLVWFFGVPLGIGAAGVLAMAAIVVGWWITAVGLAAYVASRPLLRHAPARVAFPSAVLGGLAFGYVATRMLVNPLVAEGFDYAFAPSEVMRIIIGLAVVTGVIAVFALALGVHALLRLARQPFPHTESRSREDNAAAGRTVAALGMTGILVREWSRTWGYTLAVRAMAMWMVLASVALGCRMAGAMFLPFSSSLPSWALGADVPQVGIPLAVAATATGVAEFLKREVGPKAYAAQLRFAWESGRSAWGLALSMLAVMVVPTVILGVSGLVLTAAAFGRVDAVPVLAAMSMAAAVLISEFVSRPSMNTNGSVVEDDLLATLIYLLVSAPTVFLIYRQMDLLTFVYLLILMGGATACIAHRIVHMPSSSWTLQWDTSETDQSLSASR